MNNELSMMPAKYAIKYSSSPATAVIKNQASPECLEGYFPAYSASGQDVWLPDYSFDEDSVVLSAVGARCGKTFLAQGKFGVCANTHVLVINQNVCLPKFFHYLSNNEEWWEKGGTAQPFVKVRETLAKKVYMPSLAKQAQIVSFLDYQCSVLDSVIDKTRASVSEYKKLKQSVITDAVTKGVRGKRTMKESDVEWLGYIPVDWLSYRIANLYDERSESGLEELPILTVSINSGVSDHEIADEDKDRVFVRSEDRTKYKRVYPGDLAYNMMRAWQGAFGAVRVDGMVSPAYVVAKPKPGVQLDSRYIEALLRTPAAIEEMHRYSRGIVDFRLRLYWPEFKNIRICLPLLEEQREIADYIDQKSAELDALIAKKEQFLAELENYKKSLIYEYVTGKKEVQ